MKKILILIAGIIATSILIISIKDEFLDGFIEGIRGNKGGRKTSKDYKEQANNEEKFNDEVKKDQEIINKNKEKYSQKDEIIFDDKIKQLGKYNDFFNNPNLKDIKGIGDFKIKIGGLLLNSSGDYKKLIEDILYLYAKSI